MDWLFEIINMTNVTFAILFFYFILFFIFYYYVTHYGIKITWYKLAEGPRIVVIRFVITRDPERAIIDTADCEIKCDWVRESTILAFALTNEIFERPSHVREELDCTGKRAK